MRRPLDFGIRSTSSCTSERVRIMLVRPCLPLRARNTRQGSSLHALLVTPLAHGRLTIRSALCVLLGGKGHRLELTRKA